MLAALGRMLDDAAWRAGHDDGLSDELCLSKGYRLRLLGDAQMLDLRIGENLVDLVDLAARHTFSGQKVDPFPARPGDGDRLDLRVQLVAVSQASGIVLVIGVVRPFRLSDGFGEALPDGLPGDAQIYGAVGGFVDARRHACRVIVARLVRDLAFGQPARRLEIKHEDLRLQERSVEPLPLAGFFPLNECHQHAERAEYAGSQVGDRDADAHRSAARLTGNRHESAHPLGDLIEAGAVDIGSILSEAGNAGQDDLRVDLGELGIVDTEPLLDVGTEVLDDHIGPLDQFAEDGQAFRILQVQGQAALVALQVLKVRRVAGRPESAVGLHAFGRLDLDDVGAPIAQLPRRRWPGTHTGDVQDLDMGESGGGRNMGHLIYPLKSAAPWC